MSHSPVEKILLNADRKNRLSEINQHLSQLATALAFSPDNLLDLYDHGLMPMISLAPTQHVIKDLETTIPLLCGKQVQWRMAWQAENPISTLFIKLGTGSRVNHCQLVLSIFQEQDNHLEQVATANIEGPTVQDGQWTAFQLNQPLSAGHYVGQLQSPDADNQVNTLFLWLTVEMTQELRYLKDNVLDLYHHGLTPIMACSKQASTHRSIEIPWPVLRGQTLQWHSELAASQNPFTSVLLKLGTGGKVNHCQLVLTILREEEDSLALLATATLEGHTVQDNEWNELILDRPLAAGQYICRLQSPDTDDTKHTLFVRLTKAGLDNYGYVSRPTAELLTAAAQSYTGFPKITVIIPVLERVGESQPAYLQECIDSVKRQSYPDWELCVASPKVPKLPEEHFEPVKWRRGATASVLNQALAEIKGNYFAILYPEDLLTEDALTEVAKRINQVKGTVDFLYSDEDTVSAEGEFGDPYFKPAWAKEMLKGCWYTGQLAVYRTAKARELGGFREELFPSPSLSPRQSLFQLVGQFRRPLYQEQLWDLALRLTEGKSNRRGKIQHIPKILYHRRRQPTLFFSTPTERAVMTVTLLQQELAKEDRGGVVTTNSVAPQTCLLHYPVAKPPLVSIVIPMRDMASLLESCLQSLIKMTTYPRWEVIVVDNGSQETATLELLENYQRDMGEAFKVVRNEAPFNFSRLVNHGVKVAQGEMILLLNNDTELLGPSDWLQELLGFAQHPEIACVGGKLLYPQDHTIQHAGLLRGVAGVANHGHKHWPAHSTGYFHRLAIVANYSAITGACLMVRKELWEEVEGFDENLGIAFNDVDFCLKLLQEGFRHVVLPHVCFYHHESKTRGLETTPAKQARLAQEEEYMRRRWGNILQNDPYYSRHLTKDGVDFSLGSQSVYFRTPEPKPHLGALSDKLSKLRHGISSALQFDWLRR